MSQLDQIFFIDDQTFSALMIFVSARGALFVKYERRSRLRSFFEKWAALSLALTKNISAHFALTKSFALFLRSWKSTRKSLFLLYRAL